MMKAVLFIILLIQPYAGIAQQKLWSASAGNVVFFSEAPLEDISAENKKAVSLINTATNEIVVRVPIDKFEFPNKLMQSHFNENFLESDKYPDATFKGKINESINWAQPGNYPASATGVLTIHGRSMNRTIKGSIAIAGNTIQLDSKFAVLLVDHNIEIPTLVFNKIAEEIAVTCQFIYTPYQKK